MSSSRVFSVLEDRVWHSAINNRQRIAFIFILRRARCIAAAVVLCELNILFLFGINGSDVFYRDLRNVTVDFYIQRLPIHIYARLTTGLSLRARSQ